ncbi:MAG: site-specific integrase [Leptospiraceae bacterium]|nr:site-specific integrase [Leptospiraceae bacterium]
MKIKITSKLNYNKFVKDAFSNYKRVTNKNYITPRLFSIYLNKLKTEKIYRANTIYTHAMALSRFFREYFVYRKNSKQLKEFLAVLKLHKIIRPNRVYSPVDVFSPVEFMDLVAYIKEKHFKLAVFTMLLYYTGVRISEATNIRLVNCKKLDKDWTEIEIVNGKGRKNRFVVCPNFIIKLFESLNPKIYLIESSDFRPYSTRRFQSLFTMISKKYPKRVTAHLLRHSFATEHMGSGTNPEILAQIMGNTVGTIIKTYNHPKPNFAQFGGVLVDKTSELVKRYVKR